MEGRVWTAAPDTISAGSGGSAGSAGEFLTPNSAADVYQKIDLGASWRALPEGVAPKEPKGRPKDVQDKNISKYIQNIYKIYQNISEIIINIDTNHKIYIYFLKKSKFFWHLEHIRMVPHLRFQIRKDSKSIKYITNSPNQVQIHQFAITFHPQRAIRHQESKYHSPGTSSGLASGKI